MGPMTAMGFCAAIRPAVTARQNLFRSNFYQSKSACAENYSSVSGIRYGFCVTHSFSETGLHAHRGFYAHSLCEERAGSW